MNQKNKNAVRIIFRIVLYVFAVIGFFFVGVFVAMQFGWLNVKGSSADRNSYFNLGDGQDVSNLPVSEPVMPWAESAEWRLLSEVFTRDQVVINQAARDAGISPRMILSGVMGEQLRFFNNRRESFKNYFEPLKILASLSKFSFGIAGLKPETVVLIEEHLKEPNSPYYLGSGMEHVADYSQNESTNLNTARMNRITDTKNPYYSYLYVGLYMREVIAQWRAAGYEISDRPEILATLYNLGFNRSIPKAGAMAGGAEIMIGGTYYTFGEFAKQFYDSGELINIFSR